MHDSRRHVNGCARLDIPALVADDGDPLASMNEYDFILIFMRVNGNPGTST